MGFIDCDVHGFTDAVMVCEHVLADANMAVSSSVEIVWEKYGVAIVICPLCLGKYGSGTVELDEIDGPMPYCFKCLNMWAMRVGNGDLFRRTKVRIRVGAKTALSSIDGLGHGDDDPIVTAIRHDAEGSDLARALREATSVDVEFEEERVEVHEDGALTKVGHRPIAVRGVPVPREALVTYVRAEDASGVSWYVLDGTRAVETGRPDQTFVESDEEARSVALARLRAAAAAGLL